MARLLFRLANVPADEAEDIRTLLTEHEIGFYETDAGFWRVGLDAIWLLDNQREQDARALIAKYQRERSASHRNNCVQLEATGQAPGFGQMLLQQPLRVLGVVIAIVFVLGLSLIPFAMMLKAHIE